MPSYETYDIKFEYRTTSSDMRRLDRAIVTIWGAGELALKAEIERQRPECVDVRIIELHPYPAKRSH